MIYTGHFKNGVVVPDEPAPLKEGAAVQFEVIEEAEAELDYKSLRGMPCKFVDPFEPAVPVEDWEVER